MANIHQDGNSIRNIQVVSSNCVHSAHLCEANKCRIFKPFFVYQIKGFLILLSKKNLKKINLRVRFLALEIAFFGGFENDDILSSKSYTVTKSKISPQRKLGSLRNLKLKPIRYKLITKKIFVKICACTGVYEA